MDLVLPGSGAKVRAGKLLCIGRNYAAHAAEMDSPVPERPVVFLKPASALIGSGQEIVLPKQSHDVHHEVELVAVIGRGGRHIAEPEALSHVAAYAVGLDMTARDLQAEAKRGGLPWSVAKGFDTFAPMGPLAPASSVANVQNLELSLHVNGVERQRGTTALMLFSVAALVAYCSSVFTLEPGDLLFTGTPAGVGPVRDGDVLQARCTHMAPLAVRVRGES